MNDIFTSIEAINFQGKSQLGKDFTEIFQDVMDFRDSLKYDGMDDRQQINFRLTSVSKYLEKVAKPNLTKAIKTHTNLTLKELVQTSPGELSGLFAIQMAYNYNAEEFSILINRGTGVIDETSGARKSLKTKLEALIEYSGTLDIKSGKFEKGTYGAARKPMEISLYIDPSMAFNLTDFIDVSLVGGAITARELAGIYLHEIGHFISIVERFRDSYLHVESLKSHILKDLQFATNEELFELFLGNGDDILFHPKIKENLSKKNYETYSTYVNNLKKAAEYIKSNSVPDAIATFFVRILLSTIWVFVSMTGKLILLPISISFFNIINTVGEFRTEESKTSDMSNSKNFLYRMERDADEYAVRSGYGADLASALNKLESTFKIMNYATLNTNLHKCSLYWGLAKFFSSISTTVSATESETVFGYEDHVDRLYRMLQNNRVIFKQELPKDVADRFIKEHEGIMKQYNIAVKEYNSSIAQAQITGLIQVINLPGKLISSITTGRLVNDYEKWVNKLDDIINNSLYYQAQKFKQLSRK